MAAFRFENDLVCLGPIDNEKDAAVEVAWTVDAGYMQIRTAEVPRPLSKMYLKKLYEKIEKRMDESGNFYYFTIRSRTDDRLLGFVQLDWISWSNNAGSITIAIGAPQDRGQGYGTQALKIALEYAFRELNLHRVTAWVPEWNAGALRFFQRAGFVIEARRRQAALHQGKRYDSFVIGLLRPEWEAQSALASLGVDS